MPSFENARKSNAPEYQTHGEPTQDRIFDEFCADRETVAALGVTAEEFRELSRASLLGTLTSKDDLMFMLRQIRAAMNPAAPPANEPLTTEVNHLAEKMRLAALAKLDELDLKADRRRRSAVGRIEAALAIVMTTLNRARPLALKVSNRLSRRSANSRPV